MRQVPSDKYSVAWFKLAEFVSRGEKERALGLYRLLIHSFDDSAFGCQLAGDLLLSFNDAEAIQKYKEAAELYKKNGRLMEAAAVYEQLVLLQAQEPEHLRILLELYSLLNYKNQYNETWERLLCLLMANRFYQEIQEVFTQFEACQFEETHRIKIYEKIILIGCNASDIPHEFLTNFLKPVLIFFVQQSNNQLQAFLEKVRVLNEDYYQKAQKLLHEI